MDLHIRKTGKKKRSTKKWKTGLDKQREKKKKLMWSQRERKKAATSVSNGFPVLSSNLHRRGYAPFLCHS